jgi:hypothetical protein
MKGSVLLLKPPPPTAAPLKIGNMGTTGGGTTASVSNAPTAAATNVSGVPFKGGVGAAIKAVPASTLKAVPVSTLKAVPVSTLKAVPVSTLKAKPAPWKSRHSFMTLFGGMGLGAAVPFVPSSASYSYNKGLDLAAKLIKARDEALAKAKDVTKDAAKADYGQLFKDYGVPAAGLGAVGLLAYLAASRN